MNFKYFLFVITFALLPFKSNAAVILDTFNIEYSDIYSSYVDLWFDDTVYNDGNYVLSGPSSYFINQQYGGRIDSLSTWQVEVAVSGDTASLISMSWVGQDASVSITTGNLSTIKDYHGWNVGTGSYSFAYSVAPTIVPLPASLLLLSSGLFPFVLYTSRRRKLDGCRLAYTN